MKKRTDRQYRVVRMKYDDLLWGSLILAFGTELVNALLFPISIKTQMEFYSAAGLLVALYVYLSYAEYFKRK